MGFVQASSDGIGTTGRTYHIGKYAIRRQWALCVSTPGLLDIAAYFRSEQHARDFADTFGLTITEHPDD